MITSRDYFVNPIESMRSLGNYTLPDVFDAVVRAKGDEPAVFDGLSIHTWGDWALHARALARGLQELGVEKGDVVALHLPNCWEYLVAHVAIALVGAVTLPLHMAYGEHEIRVLLERTAASVLIMPTVYHTRDILGLARSLQNGLPCLQHLLLVGHKKLEDLPLVSDLLRQWAGTTPTPVEIVPDDPFALLASSGTTSLRPKICMHSHAGLLSNAAMVVKDGDMRADDIVVSASPLTHLFGLLSFHLSLFSRGCQSLLPAWNTDTFLNIALQTRATVAFLVPAQLRDVCLYLDSHPDVPRIHLREIRSGGARVPASLIADTRRILGARVIVQWGMSELGAGLSTRPEDPPEAVSNSVGRPITHAEVCVVDDNGHPLPVGETGELLYRGPYLFRGYLLDPVLTQEAVTADGWLHTGDLASLNADGTVTYQGRRVEFINRGGLKFSAVEVESLLSDMPQLYQFAVLCRPDPRLGERSLLVAAVQPGITITLADVIKHLAAKGLATYKWPEELILLNELPCTPTGKIARARLIQQLQLKADEEASLS